MECRLLLTEHGLHFEREHDVWRCKEHPRLCMTQRGFEVEGHPTGYASLTEALAALGVLRMGDRPEPA